MSGSNATTSTSNAAYSYSHDFVGERERVSVMASERDRQLRAAVAGAVGALGRVRATDGWTNDLTAIADAKAILEAVL